MTAAPAPLRIAVRLLEHAAGLPSYASPAAAGMDLMAATDSPKIIAPMQRLAVPTGICMAIPDGYEGQVRPRSGLACRHGLTIANAPGTIDSDYRGEILVLLVNLGTQSFTLEPAMRIAQLVIAPVLRAELEVVSELPSTRRGSGGFGSTGTTGIPKADLS